MNSAQVGAVLGYVRQLAAVHKDDDLPDHQLLERFALSRDEAAFATLLRRHGPMVLAVCRSVLHNLHDAEDAFQATFLVLARKAGSIHRRALVSSWLQRVAYHLAVDAQANAARRRLLEQRAAIMPSADPVLDLSLRELRRVLNEEIQQLPDEFRAPLVLCCVEEKSLGEAARLLGWTKGTVKGRLQRGRERLRARLRRRGLELSLGLFAAVLSTRSVSAQVPAALADATLRAAVKVGVSGCAIAGVVSAEVAALVQGASKSMFSSKAKIATALLLALSIAAAAFGVVRHQAIAADPPAAEQNPAEKSQAQADPPKPAAEETREVRGQVLDPEGKPVAGAKLYLAKFGENQPAPSEKATSGPDGRFRFALAKSELDNGIAQTMQAPGQVMAVAEGHGCDWVTVGSAAEDVTLRLVKDVAIRGRILDTDGQPVVGARLTVTGLSADKGDDLGVFVESRKGDIAYELLRVWSGPLPGQPAVLTTGADGCFRLAGAGRERVVHFYLEGPAIASTDLDVMTRAAEKVGGARSPLYGASFDCVGVPARPVRGVVRDKDTGKPLAGVTVRGWTNPQCKAVTDEEGRYELLGLAKSGLCWLAVKPADGRYFQRQVGFEDTPGLGALTGDIELVRGLTVRGKVTDKATDEAVAQAQVEYYPLFPNPHVNARLAGRWVPRAEAITAADGSYALTVLPGPGVIGVAGPRRDRYIPAWVTLQERKDFFKSPLVQPPSETILNIDGGGNLRGAISQDNFHALVLLEPGEKEEGLVKDVALDPGHVVRGRVVGPDGQPLPGVTVFGRLQLFSKEVLPGAELTMRRNPREPKRPLVFYHKEKNLGYYVKELQGDNSEPLTVKLQPCGSASGRIVDPDGEPVVGQHLVFAGRALPILSEAVGGALLVTTDKEGRFRVEGLIPGQEYRVSGAHSSDGYLRIHALALVEPGKHQDLGDIKMTPRGK
jgi:RNA polymerase sigma factor (sigma-70 family)